MMHHSLLPHFALQPMIANSDTIAKKFASWGIKLVFTGHLHANDISVANDKNSNTVYDVQTGSLSTSPNAYREVKLSDEKIEINSRYVTKIDTSYLSDGYTEKQLEMLENNFPEFAKGYFDAGVCRWLSKYIGSAGKVGKMLKLSPDSAEYAALDGLMRNIGEALNLPIYDDKSTPDVIDSIEEIANSAGSQIPKSDYKKLYQVAATIMGGFYHGDESASIKETEIPLLYACIKAALVRSIANIAYSTKTAKGFDLLARKTVGISPYENLIKDISKGAFASAMADKIIEEFVAVLADGLSEDLSAPSDINVTLSGYGTNDKADKEYELNLFARIVKYILKFIKSILPYLPI